MFWQGVGIAALAVAAPEALPLEWAAEAEAAGEAAEATEAATAESEGLNDINILQKDFDHVIEGHTAAGSDTAGNSIFLGDAQDVANLIQISQTDAGIFQPDTWNWAYVNYTTDAIGETTTGQYTFVYTVIVDMFGNLVTAFPGLPLP